MIIVVDVETIDKAYQGVCDIAWALVSRNKIKTVKNFIPLEHMAKMTTGCFSGAKVTATMEVVARGEAVIKPWDDIMTEFVADCEEATRIYAYNANFDRDKILKTCQMLASPYTEKLQTAEYFDKWRDLWAWASNTILYKKSFIDFCEVHGLKTEKGFCSTTAETCIKYLTGNVDYVEQHTARADVIDECGIYQAIKTATKSEYREICPETENFSGKPFYNIKRLKDAINA